MRGKLPLLDRLLIFCCSRFWRFYQYANFTVDVKHGSCPIRIPIIHGLGKSLLNFYDQNIQTLISMLYTQGRRGYFIDVGANVGRVLLNLVLQTRDIPYIAFEPDLAAAYYLHQLIKANRLDKHFIIPIALGSGNSMSEFHFNFEADASATLGLDLRPKKMYAFKSFVGVSTGDDLLSQLDQHPIFLIKIDVEGLELDVLKGMEDILLNKRPPVYFEVLGCRHLLDGVNATHWADYFGKLEKREVEELVSQRRENQIQLVEFFRVRNYKLYRCNEDHRFVRVTTLDPSPKPQEDFLALPQELEDGVAL
jgi:FkbM family methyltransferase